MVSDVAFYVTLGIAIALGALVAFIIYTMKTKFPPEMMRIMTTMHASLFGYETAMVDLIGPRGYRTHVFPEIIKVMNTLKEESSLVMDVFGANSAVEAMEKWIKVMEKAKILKDGSIRKISDDEVIINVGNCGMSYPIHEVMGQKKGICPLALIIASASAIVEKDKEPVISYSNFTPTGTETTLKFKPKDVAEK
jgi:hypothetical protein